MPATIQTKLFNETPDTIYAVDLFQITHKTALKWLSFFANILDRKVLPSKCRKRWNLAKSPRLSTTTVKMVDAKQAWFLCEVEFPPCTAHFQSSTWRPWTFCTRTLEDCKKKSVASFELVSNSSYCILLKLGSEGFFFWAKCFFLMSWYELQNQNKIYVNLSLYMKRRVW